MDILLTLDQVAKMPSVYRETIVTYSYIDQNGNFVLCWELGKYVNHSCNPSYLDFGLDSCVAVRDIFPGEELTCDYGSLNLINKLKCHCNAANCRGEIQNTDATIHSERWGGIFKEVLPCVGKVEQPLYPFIQNKPQFDAIINGKMELPSSKKYYCAPDKMDKIRSFLSLTESDMATH